VKRRAPRRPGPSAAAERREARVAGVHGAGAAPHLVVAGVAGDADAAGAHAERHEPLGVVGVDRADGVERGVRVAQQGGGQRSAARRAGGERRTHEPEAHPAPARAVGERRPDVELAEHEGARRERREQRLGVARGVEREEVGDVGQAVAHEAGRVRGRARRVVRVAICRSGRCPGARARGRVGPAEPLADARRVHPEERARRVAVRGGPTRAGRPRTPAPPAAATGRSFPPPAGATAAAARAASPAHRRAGRTMRVHDAGAGGGRGGGGRGAAAPAATSQRRVERLAERGGRLRARELLVATKKLGVLVTPRASCRSRSASTSGRITCDAVQLRKRTTSAPTAVASES
jgi:hypothetical protein